MASDVDAIQEHRPGLRLDQPLDRAQRARLAGAVRAEQPEDLATGDLKADAVDGRLGAIGDRQVTDLQDDTRVGWVPLDATCSVDALGGPGPDDETIQNRVGDQLRDAVSVLDRLQPISERAVRASSSPVMISASGSKDSSDFRSRLIGLGSWPPLISLSRLRSRAPLPPLSAGLHGPRRTHGPGGPAPRTYPPGKAGA